MRDLLEPPPDPEVSREVYDLINTLPDASEDKRSTIGERLGELANQIDADRNSLPPSTP